MIGSIEPGNRTRGLPKTHGVLDRLDDSHCEGIRGVELVGRRKDRAKTSWIGGLHHFAMFPLLPDESHMTKSLVIVST
jgi:hypothetical protein